MNNEKFFQQKIESNLLTCTLASERSSRNANSSLVKTSGYWVFSNALSSWCSWNVVNVVRDLRTFLGLSVSLKSIESFKVSGIWWSTSSVSPESLTTSEDVAWSANKLNLYKINISERTFVINLIKQQK